MRRLVVTLAATAVVAAVLVPGQIVSASPDVSSRSAEAATAGASSPADSTAASDAHSRTVVPRASAQGRKGQTLTVTPTARLAAAGQSIKVSGRGFSELVGIYVGLCVMPRPGVKPTPCGGGVDQDGSSQASAWISSNPPPYGSSLAIPYKRGGKFSVRIKVSPRIGAYDCRVVRCAVVARADHTRANDRTWDVAVPVTFR
jgi:hypothetical protein